MTIKNMQLKKNERDLISEILSRDFIGRDTIIEQINKSQIFRNNNMFYLSIRFLVSNECSPLIEYVRVPVEMIVHKKGYPLMQVLLHVVSGFVDELEVFFVDSSAIEESIGIDKNDIVDIIINE